MRKLIAALAPIVLLHMCLSVTVTAQNSCRVFISCGVYNLWYTECIPPLPPGAHDCATIYGWTEECEIPSRECSPSPCPTCNGATAAMPIALADGNTYIQQSDVLLPGLGGGLALTRTWNSLAPAEASYGMFGYQWSSNFEERISLGSDYLMKYFRGDGTLWSYGFGLDWGPDGYTPIYGTAAPRNDGSTLTYFGFDYPGHTGLHDNPYWVLTSKNGEVRTFRSPTFQLASITDRNGNTVTLSYGSGHLLTTVTDAASRQLYFAYGTILVGGIPVSVVTGVTSNVGVSLSYQYDSMGNLTKVIKPNGTFVSFEYSPAGLLTAVKDSNGKILESHTYDVSKRGLTSSRAGGVDSVTVSY